MQQKKAKFVLKKSVGRKKAEIFCLLGLSFMLVQWAVFFVGGNFNSVLLAFQYFDSTTFEHKFFGGAELFTNFGSFLQDLFSNPRIIKYFWNGVIYHLVGLVAIPVSLMFAFVVYKKMPASEFFKIMLFLPSVVSAMVIALMFKKIQIDGFRWIYTTLFHGEYADFRAPLASEGAFITLILYQFFFALPGQLLINVGTMSRVPNELIEYGKLEGLPLFKEFLHVTVPLMFPIIEIYCLGLFVGFFTSQGPLFAIYGKGGTTDSPDAVKSFGYYMMVSVMSNTTGGRPEHMYGYTSAGNLLIGVVSIPIIYLTKKILDKIDPKAEY